MIVTGGSFWGWFRHH